MRLASGISGIPMPDLQWYAHGVPVSGETNDVLDIPSVSAKDAGVYWVVASHSSGVVTNGPVTWGVNNVVASNYFGFAIPDSAGIPLQIQSAGNILGPWTLLAALVATNSPHTFVDVNGAGAGQLFYRTTSPGRLEPRRFRGWSFTTLAGSRVKIEYVDAESGYNNWQLLTLVTPPSSPYLYIDTSETVNWPRYYRTTPMP